MASRSGVFLFQNEDVLVGMEPAHFAKEDDFQRLLQRFPDLLVGDQIDQLNPRKWVLVKREQQVSTGELGAALWSVDHVFLDQDGIPTLVEIKRQSDARNRREVVGQMLDYAASCSSYWSVDTLQAAFEKTCGEMGKSSTEVLANLIGAEGSTEEFWRRVKDNLQSRNIRLLFVADSIPVELRRIVEFLNEQMMQVEVLAIELRQFAANGVKAIVPTVYGQTQAAAQKRAAGRTWDEASVFDKLARTASEKEMEIAKEIYAWMGKEGKRAVKFGTGQGDGSVYPIFAPSGVRINPVYLSSNGKLYFQFGSLENKPVFGTIESRRALMQRLNMIRNVGFTEADLTKYPGIPLSVIASDPEGPTKIMSVLHWIDEQMAEHERTRTGQAEVSLGVV